MTNLRDKLELEQAKENLLWLSEPEPKFSCGTKLTLSEVKELRRINETRISELQHISEQTKCQK